MSKRSIDKSRTDTGSVDEKCCFCGASAFNIIDGSFPKAYCLLHYYTTRACRKKNVRSLNDANLITENEIQDVQKLFEDAFLSLQSEIKEAAARYNPKDPLSLVNNTCSKQPTRKESRKEIVPSNQKFDGGFMPGITEWEKTLMEQHIKSSHMKEVSTNPYKRKKFPNGTVWHQAMNNYSLNNKWTETSHYIDKCSCGSDQVILEGFRIHRSEEGAKAEIWGTKQDNNAMNCYRCLICGANWNKQE